MLTKTNMEIVDGICYKLQKLATQTSLIAWILYRHCYLTTVTCLVFTVMLNEDVLKKYYSS